MFSVILRAELDWMEGGPGERFQFNIRNDYLVEGPNDIPQNLCCIYPSQGWTMRNKLRMVVMPLREFKY